MEKIKITSKNKLGTSILLTLCIIVSIFCSSVAVYAEETSDELSSLYITQAYNAMYEENYDQAIEYCNKAIEIISEPSFYSLKAEILKRQEKYEEALKTLNEVLALSPQYAEAYSAKAYIYVEQKKYIEAIECFDKGIAVEPGYVSLYMYKALLLTEMNRSDEAIESYKLGIKNNPKVVSLYSQLSYQLFKSGDNAQILECLTKIIELNPNNEEALYNLACLYSLENKPTEALSYLKKAIELSPKNKTSALMDKELDNIKNTEGFNLLTDIGVYVDGKFLEFDVPPSLEEGRVLLPLRVVFESLGASLEWVDSTKTVKGQMGDISLSLQIGSKSATINGKEVSLDVPGKIVNGRTLVPIRFVSESFGADVKWDSETKTVYVTSNEEYLNDTGLSKDQIIKKLDLSLDILAIDGIFPEPYGLDSKEAKMLCVAVTENDLKLFRSLTKSEKIEYMNNAVQSNYGSVIGCDTIEASFIYDGKMYYKLNTHYDANSEGLELETYKIGMPVNVIEQDHTNFSYVNYYNN